MKDATPLQYVVTPGYISVLQMEVAVISDCLTLIFLVFSSILRTIRHTEIFVT